MGPGGRAGASWYPETVSVRSSVYVWGTSLRKGCWKSWDGLINWVV